MNSVYTVRSLRYPSALRGASRVADLFGKLDEYKTGPSTAADTIHQAWRQVGSTVSATMSDYEKED